MRYRVNNHGAAPPAGTITSNTPNLPDPFNLPGGAVGAPNGMQNGYRFPSYRQASTQQSTHGRKSQMRGQVKHWLSLAEDGDLTIFKPSPFYELQELLLKDVVLEGESFRLSRICDAHPSQPRPVTDSQQQGFFS